MISGGALLASASLRAAFKAVRSSCRRLCQKLENASLMRLSAMRDSNHAQPNVASDAMPTIRHPEAQIV